MAELQTDLLGPPYTCETWQLRPDDEGEVFATLVHRPAGQPTRKAVLHVHGFCDYFFQTGAADFWVRNGYDFYALDLRKYGRSCGRTRHPTTSRTWARTTKSWTWPSGASRRSTTTSCSPRTRPVV